VRPRWRCRWSGPRRRGRPEGLVEGVGRGPGQLRRHRADPRTVEADADALLERWRIAQLLGRLPEDERALLRMRFYDELSQSEITAATGIPLGTVKARMVRSLTRLREMIEVEGA
jgi:RNA polymerase sigma factor (sigma-70 family)